MNPFKVSYEEKTRRIVESFSSIVLPDGTGALLKVLSVKPFATESSSPMLLVEVQYTKSSTIETWVVRATQLGLDAQHDAAERFASHWTGTLHKMKLRGLFVQQYGSKWERTTGGMRRELEVKHPIDYLPGQISFEGQVFFPDSVTLFDYFKEMQGRTELSRKDETIIEQLSESLFEAHSHREIPVSLPDREAVSLDTDLDENDKNDYYNASLADIMCRYHFYRGSSPEHPVLTTSREEELERVIKQTTRAWHNRGGERLVLTLGDLHAMNTLIQAKVGKTLVYFIDPHHRGVFLDRGYDVGRLRFDCVEWHLATENPIYLKFGDLFLDVHAARTKDKELGVASNMGMLSRLFWKICPRNQKNRIHVGDGINLQNAFDSKHGLLLYRAIVPAVKAGNYKLYTK